MSHQKLCYSQERWKSSFSSTFKLSSDLKSLYFSIISNNRLFLNKTKAFNLLQGVLVSPRTDKKIIRLETLAVPGRTVV